MEVVSGRVDNVINPFHFNNLSCIPKEWTKVKIPTFIILNCYEDRETMMFL